jgi:hypothetical protein
MGGPTKRTSFLAGGHGCTSRTASEFAAQDDPACSLPCVELNVKTMALLERRTVRSANSYAAIAGARRWMASRLTTAA